MQNKYKYSRNFGLIPKLKVKYEPTSIVSYAILERDNPRQYQIALGTNDNHTFVLFNNHEYLHRGCSYISSADNNHMLEQIQQTYCQENHSLTIFVANDPSKCKEIIVDNDKQNSLLKQLYQNCKKQKRDHSTLVFSVIGIQNQNILTDQMAPTQETSIYELANKVRQRPALQLKNVGNHQGRYRLENLSQWEINSVANFNQFISQYFKRRNQNEIMALSSEKYWNWLQGQIFVLSQVQYDHEYDVQRTIKTHYLLRVNQYLKFTSPLMLKLGMNLRKFQENTNNLIENGDSKLFKLLSDSFSRRRYHKIFLFLQVGHQNTLKEQYLSLVPTSQILQGHKDNSTQLFQGISFIYLKNYVNYPKIAFLVSQLKQKQQNNSSNNFDIPKNHLQKSYAYETFSSLEKKIVKNNLLQENVVEEDVNLQKIIQETALLYKRPNPSFQKQVMKRKNETTREIQIKDKLDRPRRANWTSYNSLKKDVSDKYNRQKAIYISSQKNRIKYPQSSLQRRVNQVNHDFNISSELRSNNGKKIRNLRTTSDRKTKTKQLIEEILRNEISSLGQQYQKYQISEKASDQN